MCDAIYNSPIPDSAHRNVLAPGMFDHTPSCAPRLSLLLAALVFCFIPFRLAVAGVSDWDEPAQQLARNMAAVTAPGAAALTVENRSSLSKKDTDAASGALRADLEAAGLRLVNPEQAAAFVAVSLSENAQFYLWIAEIRQGAGEAAVVMVSVARAEGVAFAHEAMPVTIRKTPLWAQEDRILDVAVLQESAAPTYMAVLDPEKVALYRMQNAKWQQEQVLAIAHVRPWSRDMRGRLIAAKDHLLDVYLPGVFCRSTTAMPLSLSCRDSDDPWPLVATNPVSFPAVGAPPASAPQLAAFYAATRNFFTGALAPGVGKLTTLGKFYSAAPLPREKYVLWLFAGTDGQTHFVDGVSDQAAKLGWGSDIASVKTLCSSGWQLLAAGAGSNDADSMRAYEFPDRDPVPVSAALDFPGEITALWTEGKGDTAIVVTRNRKMGDYEAFRLAMACGQ